MYNGITIRSRSPPEKIRQNPKTIYSAHVDDLVHVIVYLLDGMIFFFFFIRRLREARVFHWLMDENFFFNIIDGNDATDDRATRSTIEIRHIPHYYFHVTCSHFSATPFFIIPFPRTHAHAHTRHTQQQHIYTHIQYARAHKSFAYFLLFRFAFLLLTWFRTGTNNL